MKDNRKRKWYPISFASTFGVYIDQMLEDSESQYKLLLSAKNKPGIVENSIVSRIKEAPNPISRYQEQLDKWNQESQNSFNQEILKKLAQKLSKARKVNNEVLDLAEYLRKNPSNKILAKDAAEFGLDFLLDRKN
jgi:hypothetical protein